MVNYGESIRDRLDSFKVMIERYDEFQKNPKIVPQHLRGKKFDRMFNEYVPTTLREFPFLVEYIELLLKDIENKTKENITLKKQKKNAYSTLGWGHYDLYDSRVDERFFVNLSMKKGDKFSDFIGLIEGLGEKVQSSYNIGILGLNDEHLNSLREYYNDSNTEFSCYKEPEFGYHKELNYDDVALITNTNYVYWDIESIGVDRIKGVKFDLVYVFGIDRFDDLFMLKRRLK